ncbi:unnamed protein product, partial [Strongylus vulgaris]
MALAQKGESLAALSTMPSLPIPFLQSVQIPPTQQLSSPIVNVAKPPTQVFNFITYSSSLVRTPAAKEHRHSSLFIPTSLLLGRRNNKKKEADLIGDVTPPPPSSSFKSLPSTPEDASQRNLGPSANNTPSTSSQPTALNDLCSIDWSCVPPPQST